MLHDLLPWVPAKALKYVSACNKEVMRRVHKLAPGPLLVNWSGLHNSTAFLCVKLQVEAVFIVREADVDVASGSENRTG